MLLEMAWTPGLSLSRSGRDAETLFGECVAWHVAVHDTAPVVASKTVLLLPYAATAVSDSDAEGDAH